MPLPNDFVFEQWIPHLGTYTHTIQFPDGLEAVFSVPSQSGVTKPSHAARVVAISHVPRMVQMLQQLEWSATKKTGQFTTEDACPRCARSVVEGHSNRCDLSALLRDLGVLGA